MSSKRKKPREKAYILERRIRIRRCMERGYATVADLSARFGISVAAVEKDQAAIYEEWRREWNDTPEGKRRGSDLRQSQLEKVLTQADEAHERSKQDDTTVKTTITPQSCPGCRGTGFEAGKDEWCTECGGEGDVMEEVTVTSVRGQAGDAQHLRVKLEAVRELNKMKGNVDEKEGGGEAPVQNMYIGWTSAMVIELMKAQEEARLRIEGERRAIEVESVEVEGGG